MVLRVIRQMAALAPVLQVAQILNAAILRRMVQVPRSQHHLGAGNWMWLTIRGPAIRVRRRTLTSIPGPLAHQLDDLFPVFWISELVFGAYWHCSFSSVIPVEFGPSRTAGSCVPEGVDS